MSVTEQQTGRSIDLSSGNVTASRSFHVSDAADEDGVMNAFGSEGMPDYTEQHPVLPNLYALSNKIALVAGHNDLWTVTWTYGPIKMANMPNTAGDFVTPATPGFLRYSSNVAGQFQLAWRTDPDYTIVGIGAGSDINGTGIDYGGNPTSVLRVKMNFVVSVTEEYGEIRWDTIRRICGTRNSGVFLGLPTDQILYMGANAQRQSADTVSLSHSFEFDEQFHLQQVVFRNDLGNTESVAGPVEIVNHIQPFPSTSDFGDLSKYF